MKKSLCALAAILLAGAAHAQSSVTLYGVIDGSVEYVNRVASAAATPTQGGSRFGMPSVGGLSASRWGLRGVEELGAGNKALFVLESGFQFDTGALQSAPLFNRQSFVGLQNGDYGKVTFGRQYTSFFDGMANFAPLRFAATYEPGIWWMGLNYREDNMIKYTGQFGPLQAVGHFSFGTGVAVQNAAIVLANGGAGEVPGHFSDNTAYGGSLMYLDGSGLGFSVGADIWRPAAVTGQPGKMSKYGAAALYTTGPFKFTLGYRYNKGEFPNGNTLLRDDYWWAGVNYQATPALVLSMAYYYADAKGARTAATSPETNPANMQQVSFIADYSFSKRTDVYLSLGYAHNGGLSFDGLATAYAFKYPTMAGQTNMVGVTVGVRQVF
ncbi:MULTISPECIES: porin [Cupriavidus]|uniref:Porin, Gram-negative type n=1 Tax=Cupriavidus pinatubonensis (strain JMP 134 / LMG 1197) TaxID=264198 RepID=Q46TK9_CUPPJ|nr:MULTISPECIES: porin [Cupriavidus]TPQ35843.1 porin [Cupriavidus pinatubonensis]